jgi:regulatory protein
VARGAAPPSLKARALRWLAQREHSRAELRRKLLPHAAAEAGGGRDAQDGQGDREAAAAQVDALLDLLEREKLLSEQRFVESRVHVRAARFGLRRIQTELAGHGLALPPALAETLRDDELQRAHALWQRRFGAPAADAAGRAKQARFLIGRGFSAEVVRRVVKGLEDTDG